MVALRKESVDRNWRPEQRKSAGQVALRKESVDRNSGAAAGEYRGRVALRKESVDRNCAALAAVSALVGRSPQGERG